jgi:4-hydroxy-4-methyl-2-oxoglutarate aldolase
MAQGNSNNPSQEAGVVDQLMKEYEEYKAQGRIWGGVPPENIKRIKFPRINQKIIEEFLALDDLTGSISDVLDTLGIKGAIPASYLPPLIPSSKIAGTAITLRSIPERKTVTKGLMDKDYIRMATRDTHYLAEPGDILVADFGGNLDVSNMGGQSVAVAQSRGVVGAIVNGAVRDVPSFRKRNFPTWCRGTTPITGKCRMQAVEINGLVSLHETLVEPGDLVVADDSGVCVIPADKVNFVLEKCKSIIKEEEKMRELIDNEVPISELKPLYRKRYS